MISPLAVALQGIGYSALLVAVQGFGALTAPPVITSAAGIQMGGGGRRRRRRRHSLRDDEKAFVLCHLG